VGTFAATPADDGSWDIAAKFQPHGVSLTCTDIMPGSSGAYTVRLRGTGTAEVNAIPDVPITITAIGLYSTSGKVSWDSPFAVTIIIDQDGVVELPAVFADTGDASEEDQLAYAAEGETTPEDFEGIGEPIDIVLVMSLSGACEDGSYLGTSSGGSRQSKGQAKRHLAESASEQCASACAGLDACAERKPHCVGNAILGDITCFLVPVWDLAGGYDMWVCNAPFTCRCSCARNP